LGISRRSPNSRADCLIDMITRFGVSAWSSHLQQQQLQQQLQQQDRQPPQVTTLQQPPQRHEEREVEQMEDQRRRSLHPRAGPEPAHQLPSVWAKGFELDTEEPLLGGGAFAKVLKVTERASGQQFAVKVMSRSNFAMRGIEAQVDLEIEVMRHCAKSELCHHVVRLYEVAEENDLIFLRLELCSYDLLRYASNQPGNRLTEKAAMAWTQQLLKGLRDLHCLGILHRDVKPDNLLCTHDGILKIADFGWCADTRHAPSTLAGTFQYMAPEILGAQGVQTEAVDVWSSGVTMLQLLTGLPLLTTYLGPGATNLTLADPHGATKVKTASLLQEIGERCPLADEVRPPFISPHCWDLFRRLLTPEVPLRITVAEALGHPWLQEAPGQMPPSRTKDKVLSMVLQVPTPARATPGSSIRTSIGGLARKPMSSGRWGPETASALQGDATPSAPSAPPQVPCARTRVLKQVYPSRTSEARPPLVDTVATTEPWDLTRARSPDCGDADQKISRLVCKIQEQKEDAESQVRSVVERIVEARESDEHDPSELETAGAEVVLATITHEQAGTTLVTRSTVSASPMNISRTECIDPRSPFSDRTDHTSQSYEHVPTPLKPRSWDPDRNMAYSPPVKKLDPQPVQSDSPASQTASEAGGHSPERSPERRMDAAPSSSVDPSLSLLQSSPSRGRQTPVPPSPLLATARKTSVAVPLVTAPFPRLSSHGTRRSVSPTQTSRSRGTSLGLPPQHVTVHRAFGLGGAPPPPTVSAPRLRLSAPGDLLGGSVPTGAVSARAIPQFTNNAEPLTASPKRQAGPCHSLLDSTSPWTLRPRHELMVDPHALLTELHNTNENLRMAFAQLVSSMRKPGCHGEAAASAANIKRVAREGMALTAAVLEPLLPPGHGAASAPVASPVIQPMEMADNVLSSLESAVASSYNDDFNAAVLDILSATAPPHCGTSTPGVLAPLQTTWEGQPPTQPLIVSSGEGRREASKLRLKSAPGLENYAPTNMSLADGKTARVILSGSKPPSLKAREGAVSCSNSRQAGSVQMRALSMPRYGQCPRAQALAGKSHLDVLSQTVSHRVVVSNLVPPSTTVRECRTPTVPNWPRATSPDTCRCTQEVAQPQQPVKAQAIPQSTSAQASTVLPAPRLAVSQPPRSGGSSGTTLSQRLAATPKPAPAAPQHVWAYSAGGAAAATVYRGCDARRRASMPGGAYYARAAM